MLEKLATPFRIEIKNRFDALKSKNQLCSLVMLEPSRSRQALLYPHRL